MFLIAFGFVVASHLEGTIKTIIETAGTQALGTAVHVSRTGSLLANKSASIRAALLSPTRAASKQTTFLRQNLSSNDQRCG